MRAVRLAAFEVLRFRRPLQRAALAFLVTVPLLYGAIYLWSNWDPYGKLARIPVAVVNQDRPAQAGGRTIDAGANVVDRFKKDPILGWRFVPPGRAARGLRDGRYYAVITIPPSFSADLASPATRSPRQAVMGIRLDDANNYLAGVMAKTVRSELRRQIAEAAVAAYFRAAFAKMSELHHGLGEAATGAGRLRDGLGEAKDGSGRLAGGLGDLKGGTERLAAGSRELAAGTSEAAGRGVPLAGEAAARLPGLAGSAVTTSREADDLAAAADLVAGRVAGAAAAVDGWLRSLPDAHPGLVRSRPYRDLLRSARAGDGRLAQRLRRLVRAFPEVAADPRRPRMTALARAADAAPGARVRRLAAAHPELRRDPLYRAALRSADGIAAETGRLARKARRVHAETRSYAAQARAFQREVPALRRELLEAAEGLTELDRGAQQVSAGAAEVDAGTGEALRGAKALDRGNARLESGAERLAGELSSARGRVPDLDPAARDRASKALASPVDVALSNAHPAGVYGRGLAPFFFSIALWVFGIVAFLLLRPASGRLLASRARSVSVALAGWLPAPAAGVCGALLLYAVVDLCLGLRPVSIPGTVGVLALGVACFSAIVHLLRLAFGAAGDAVALVLLMIQLVSCGGLYPVETLPLPFRALHEVVPMTYLVEPLRVTISGGPPRHALVGAAVLAGYLVAALVLSALAVARRRMWTLGRLKPDLEI